MRQLPGRVRADARVVVHVQHPDVVPGLPVREAERVGVMVGTGLEPGAVRRLVVAWDRDNSNRWTRQPHDLVTRLTGVLDDHVDAQVQEEARKLAAERPHYPLQRWIRIPAADRGDDNHEHVLHNRVWRRTRLAMHPSCGAQTASQPYRRREDGQCPDH